MRFKYLWLSLAVLLVAIIIFAGNITTVHAPTVEDEATNRRPAAYTASLSIEESQITLRPDESIADFFRITPDRVQAELQKWAGKDTTMPITITISARSAQHSISHTTPVATMDEKMPAFVWSDDKQYPIETQILNAKGITFISITATIKFGDQTQTITRTYDNKNQDTPKHPGDFRIIDTRPSLA